MIVASMNQSAYKFERCKLCGELTAAPAYPLANATIYCCKQCDFHFIDALDEESTEAEEEKPLNDNARRYIESRLDESLHLHPERIRLAESHIQLPAINALDIGAGLGQFQLLLEQEGATGYGLEPSHLRRQYAAEKFGLTLYKERVDHPFWQERFPQYFDLITFWDVIEHVNFPRATLHAAIKLLKPGGFLLLDTPSRDVLSYRLSLQLSRLSQGRISLFFPHFYTTTRYGHKQIFTPSQLVKLLKSLGMEIITLRDSYTKRLSSKDKIILTARKN